MLVSEFTRFIAPEVIGCPDPLLHRVVLQVAFRFCDMTGAWDEVSEPILTESGVDQYEIEVPSGAVALRARDVWMDGIRIPLSQTSQRVGIGFNSSNGHGILTLYPTPASQMTVVARVVFAPMLTATSLPDVLMSRYERAISSGVKADLMLMNGVSWANPTLGAYHQRVYESMENDARIESVHDRAGGSIYVAPRKFQ